MLVIIFSQTVSQSLIHSKTMGHFNF